MAPEMLRKVKDLLNRNFVNVSNLQIESERLDEIKGVIKCYKEVESYLISIKLASHN